RDLVVQVLDAPADLPFRGHRLDRLLERGVGHLVAELRLECEQLVTAGARAVGPVLVPAVVPAADALHPQLPPAGRLPPPSTKIRIHASSIASAHTRSPTRRRRVS